MRVFLVRNPSNRIKGYLRQRGVEVDPNVFVSNVTRQDAQEMWDWVVTKARGVDDFKLVLLQPETGKPGFSSKSFEDKEPSTLEIDGLTLKFRKKHKP